MKDHIFERRVRGHLLVAEILEGSWKYPSSGIGLRIASSMGGGAVLYRTELKFKSTQIADIQSMLQEIEICVCSNDYCKRMAFNPLTVTTDRDGLCETCYQENEVLQERLLQLNTLKKDQNEISLAVDRGDNFVISFDSIRSLTGSRKMNIYLKTIPSKEYLNEILGNLGQSTNTEYTVHKTPALLKEINSKITECGSKVA